MNNLSSEKKSDATNVSPSTNKKPFFSSPNKNFLKDNPLKFAKGKLTNFGPKNGYTNKPTNFNKKNSSNQSKGTNLGLKIKRVLSLSQILGRIRQQRQKK